MEEQEMIWLFHGTTGRFASGVFTTKEKAELWIKKNTLSGILTKYPVDVSVYDWAVQMSLFHVKKGEHLSSDFIQKFTSAGQEHYHFEDGYLDQG